MYNDKRHIIMQSLSNLQDFRRKKWRNNWYWRTKAISPDSADENVERFRAPIRARAHDLTVLKQI